MGDTHLIHQALHGYSEGHRLLQSSLTLSQSDLSLMAILSDISGPSSGFQFDSYMTGYPLNETYYAIAKTWVASELPRIGSVWTHTLLLRTADFETLPSMSALLTVFARPLNLIDLDRYGTPLTVDLNIHHSGRGLGTGLDSTVGARVLASLYGSRKQGGTWISTQQHEKVEPFILALWWQQWSSLRSSFTFCTLSFSARTIRRKPFVLQIGPRLHLDSSQSHELEIIDLDAPISAVPHDKWIRTLIEDLVAGESGTPLRQFLHRFGPDVGNDRSKMVPLATVYSDLADSLYLSFNDPRLLIGAPSDRNVIRRIAEAVIRSFPQPSEASSLKKALFGQSEASASTVYNRELAMLEILASTPGSDALDPRLLSVRERTQVLAQRNPEFMSNLVSQLDPSDSPIMHQEFLLGFVDALDEKRLTELWSSYGAALRNLIAQKPELGTTSKLWRLPRIQQEEIWASLIRSKPNASRMRNLVTTMLETKSDSVAEGVVAYYGTETINVVLSWVEANPAQAPSLSAGWKSILERQTDQVLSWLDLQKSLKVTTWSLLSQLGDPGSKFAFQIGMDRWTSASIAAVESKEIDIELMAFLLAVGLEAPGKAGLSIVERTFDAVHEAGLHDRLHGRSWSILETRLPGSWWDWDKCSRLREGLVRSFVEHEWPPVAFLRVSKKKQTQYQLLGACAKSKSGRSLLRRLKRVFKNGGIEEPWLKTLLSDYFEKSSPRFRAGGPVE